ncbi:MAG: TetR/AcrR family transcriptional regulator [Propionicimonas sp.]|uniref:TetR/AcrR family transcriptional regulator n=1 Tax=Propionicimonas sp. TaxID=1955623 RepID=UPI003D0D9C02
MTSRAEGYATGRARRDQIVEAATELFARVGYRHATVLQIAQHVGISRTGLLHHFGSKEALLEAVLSRRDAEDQARFHSGVDDPTGIEAIRAWVRLSRHNATVPHLVSLYAVLSAEACDPDHPAHDYFVRRYAGTVAGFESVLGRAQRAGLLVPGADPGAESRAVVALMDGLQVQWLLDPDPSLMGDVLQAKLQQLLVVPLFPGR